MAESDVLEALKNFESHFAGYELRDEVIEDFVATFRETEPDVLEEARRHIVQRSRFFPKIVELREVVTEIEEARRSAQKGADDVAFWPAERRELWARIVEHSLTCVDFNLDGYASVEACLAHAPAHLSKCRRKQKPLGRAGQQLVGSAREAGK